MSERYPFLLSFSFFLLLAGCSAPHSENAELQESYTNRVEEDQTTCLEIQELTRKFTQAHIARDTAFLNNCFTQDATIYPPNSLPVSGRKAISRINQDWVSFGIDTFSEVSLRCYGNEDLFLDEGAYFLRYGPEKTINQGNYLNVWKREKGQWKLFSNIWNSSL